MNFLDIFRSPFQWEISIKYVLVIIIIVAVCTKCMCGFVGADNIRLRRAPSREVRNTIRPRRADENLKSRKTEETLAQ